MLTVSELPALVTNEVRELLREAFLAPDELQLSDNLVLLGFDSLMLARLVVELGNVLDVDPFADEQAKVADMHTIGDVVRIYSAVM